MLRPQPLEVVHFTRVEHLGGMAEWGMFSDNEAQARGLLQIEVGNSGIKERRRRRAVPIPPGGSVADYVPFYFAPRSPMMYSIERGNVPTYQDGCGRLAYIVTNIERLVSLGLPTLLTDRNAVLRLAEFTDARSAARDDFIDWELMQARYWNSTPEEPDRMERRMAECLVHSNVPWEAVTEIVTQTRAVAEDAERVLTAVGRTTTILVRPDWYF